MQKDLTCDGPIHHTTLERIMKVKWIILWCLLLSKLSAQPVSFTDHTNKLQYVFGTMGQAKCGVDMNGDK